jgi:acetyltransferase-like isoleucine patch superfamily enzyme
MGISRIVTYPIRLAAQIAKIVVYKMKHLELSAAGVKMGVDCFISPQAYFDRIKPNMIEIGDNCMITRGCMILSHTDAFMGGRQKIWTGKREFKKVKIGNNVYIGVDTVVMPGVTIGNNVVIGAKSLINKDIPSNSVALGVPAKVVRPLDVDELRKQRQK